MLEKPDLPDEKLVSCVRDDYRLPIVHLEFLPLGADVNTAVYRAVAHDGTPYFLKLRSGFFDETTVSLPRWLCDQGIAHIIAPLATQTGQLWTQVDDFSVILYPFVQGRNGFEQRLSKRQWVELGAVLKAIHSTAIPSPLVPPIPRETYSPRWRNLVLAYQVQAQAGTYGDAIAADLVGFIQSKQGEISSLVERAERLANILQTRQLEYVLCHGDIHAGNVLLDHDKLYIVDWDTLIIAPKERDLMFIGAGIGGVWDSPQEAAWFYGGYGPTDIDPAALAYYRCERVVQDIAAYCEEIFLTAEGADRERGLHYLISQFRPDAEVEIALRSQF
jgi:spectinomycin phosphotransferase